MENLVGINLVMQTTFNDTPARFWYRKPAQTAVCDHCPESDCAESSTSAAIE